jgi:restriction endonuclease S subunit
MQKMQQIEKKYPRNFYLSIVKIPLFVQILRDKHMNRIQNDMDQYNLQQMNLIESEIKYIQRIAILNGNDFILLNDFFDIILCLPLQEEIKKDFISSCDEIYQKINKDIYEIQKKKKTFIQRLFFCFY